MAKTFGTGADPKGLVSRGVEGSGAAQIFRPSQAVQDFATGQRQQGLQKQKQKQAEAKAKAERQKNLDSQFQDLLKIDIKGWTEPDNQRLLGQYGEIEKQAAKLKAMGMNPFDDNDLTMKIAKFKLDMGALQDQKKLFELANTKAYTLATNKNITPEQFAEYEQNIKLYASKPFEERMLPENLALLDAPKVQQAYDLMKDLKSIDIGYFTETDLTEEGTGEKRKTVKQNDLLEQSKGLVEAKPEYFKAGKDRGLWETKEEAVDWTFRQKLFQADTSREDIMRSTSKSNVFGTGYSETQVNEDYEKWKADLLSGNENAAAYLTGVKMPSGEILEKTKLLTNRGEQTAGVQYDYITEFPSITADGTKIRTKGNINFAPQSLNDQELYAFYLESLRKKKRTYGKDLAVERGNTKFNQAQAKKKPKPY